MKVIIAAAQTGGHINPGIAIANKIKSENKNAEIMFIGTPRGLENDLVPKAGYMLKTIEAYGINRKLDLKNIKNMIITLKSFGKAKEIIKEFKPDIVIGTGGFICGPVLMEATKLKIPTIVHESNSFPGVTTKLLSSRVNTVLISFEEAKEKLPKAKNIVLTGTPTKVNKIDLTEEQKEKMLKHLNLKTNLPVVLVFGGSQGAKSINTCLIDIIESKESRDYQIIWASGPKQYGVINQELTKKNINISNIENVKIIPYIYNMEEMMNLADIIISRSGAMTITEIAKCEKPAIFVPFPFATENHQEYNAKVLENVGAAKIILDKDLNKETLTNALNDMLQDREKLKQMGKNASKVAIKNVEDKIYQEIKILTK
ncbi:MAG: undecaprenyldiphospho-muramoylpentapeptide beta-N-acetylglucosaminyltransferase [Clostridia bacterium]|nr:undecaprenyldiphospho-muramoylpentapeptide beta-N-acetylglucosaminyltransferase [Clostridia bacterium]